MGEEGGGVYVRGGESILKGGEGEARGRWPLTEAARENSPLLWQRSVALKQ